jgi:flagellar hook-length control protein FliK
LNPELLGEVVIELKVEGDRVAALLHVERADVRQQIENGAHALRTVLAAQGLELEELTVREDNRGRHQSPDREPPEKGRRREPDRAEDEFHVPQ